MTEISIIMPALNEEENILDAITDTLKVFDDMKIDGEVIVINDGSGDRTKELVESFMAGETRIRLISHGAPMGIGASFWDGVDQAGGEAVCMFPGDNENRALETLRYYRFLEHVDLVIPFVFNKEVRSLFRRTLSFIYRFIINTTFMVNFNYTNGTIIYRKSILKELDYRSNGFFFQTDILIRTVKKGYLFAEVPYRLDMRETGGSKAVTFPSLVNVIKGYMNLVKDMHFGKDGATLKKFAKDSLTNKRKK